MDFAGHSNQTCPMLARINCVIIYMCISKSVLAALTIPTQAGTFGGPSGAGSPGGHNHHKCTGLAPSTSRPTSVPISKVGFSAQDALSVYFETENNKVGMSPVNLPSLYFEKQTSSSCQIHALNSVLGLKFMSAEITHAYIRHKYKSISDLKIEQPLGT